MTRAKAMNLDTVSRGGLPISRDDFDSHANIFSGRINCQMSSDASRTSEVIYFTTDHK